MAWHYFVTIILFPFTGLAGEEWERSDSQSIISVVALNPWEILAFSPTDSGRPKMIGWSGIGADVVPLLIHVSDEPIKNIVPLMQGCVLEAEFGWHGSSDATVNAVGLQAGSPLWPAVPELLLEQKDTKETEL